MKKLFCIISILCLVLSGCSCQNNPHTPNDNTTSSRNQHVTEVNGSESESTTFLPDGMAYQLEDGSFISIDSLLSPMNKLNDICTGISDATDFSLVYPDVVVEKIAEYNNFESSTIYADFLHTTYVQMYGDVFTLSNDYITCTLLDEDSLKDMQEFYNEYFFVDITPDYAFIVESEFCVTYTDEAGDQQQDCTSDYYIAYSYNGVMYLDYFYVDTLDL